AIPQNYNPVPPIDFSMLPQQAETTPYKPYNPIGDPLANFGKLTSQPEEFKGPFKSDPVADIPVAGGVRNALWNTSKPFAPNNGGLITEPLDVLNAIPPTSM